MINLMKPEDPKMFEDIRGVLGVSMNAPKHLAMVMWGLHNPEEMQAEETAFIPPSCLLRVLR